MWKPLGVGLGEHGWLLPHDTSAIQNSGDSSILTAPYVASALGSDTCALHATEAGFVGGRKDRSGHWRILHISCLNMSLASGSAHTNHGPQVLLAL